MSFYQHNVFFKRLIIGLCLLMRVRAQLLDQMKPVPDTKDGMAMQQNGGGNLPSNAASDRDQIQNAFVQQRGFRGERVIQRNYQAADPPHPPTLPPRKNNLQRAPDGQGVQGVGYLHTVKPGVFLNPQQVNFQGAGDSAQGLEKQLPGEKAYKVVDFGLEKEAEPALENSNFARNEQPAHYEPSNQQSFQNVNNAQDSKPKLLSKYQFALAPDTRVWQPVDTNPKAPESLPRQAEPRHELYPQAQNSVADSGREKAGTMENQSIMREGIETDVHQPRQGGQQDNPAFEQPKHEQDQSVHMPEQRNLNEQDQNVGLPQQRNLNERDQYVGAPEQRNLNERDQYVGAPEHRNLNEQDQNVAAPEQRNLNERDQYLGAPEHRNLNEQDQNVGAPEQRNLNERDQNVDAPEHRNLNEQDQNVGAPEQRYLNEQDQNVAAPEQRNLNEQDQNVVAPEHRNLNEQDQNVAAPEQRNLNEQDQNVAAPEQRNLNEQDQNVAAPEQRNLNEQDQNVVAPEQRNLNERDQNVGAPEQRNLNEQDQNFDAQEQRNSNVQAQNGIQQEDGNLKKRNQNANQSEDSNLGQQHQRESQDQRGDGSQPDQAAQRGRDVYDRNDLPNHIPQALAEYEKTAGESKLDDAKLNVLSTIDNHLVVQQSQEGINHENNYNKVTQKPVAQPASSDDNAGGDSKKVVYKFKDPYQQQEGGKRSTTVVPPPTTPRPTPKSRPEASARKDVIWFPEYHSYSLRASVDNRFRIRHAPIPGEGSPWPMPQFYNSEKTVFYINPFSFSINAAGESCDILEYTMERVQINMFGELPESESERYSRNFHPPPGTEIRLLNVTVLRECDVFPHLDMDESYDLEVRQTGGVIIAREVWGAVRGLETFSQLLYQDRKGRFVMNKTLIHDFPRFKHRGILIDTARHYLNKETILLNLEAMAQNKMNVFHWHIVDEQSFPFVSNTYPNLTKNGAYDDKTHIYTHEVIMEIIEEARVRGIRVVPEFDTPGHTFAWGLGQDNLLTPCYDYRGRPDGFFGPINPILKSTYTFLEGLFREVLGLFKDKYVHLGGDEVSLECWNTNPYLQRFMSRNGLYDVKDLLNVYTKKLVDIIDDIGESRQQGSGYIVWQEVFDDGVKLKPDAIVQIWKGNAWDLDRVTSQGLRALFSSCWYLDYISYGQDWDKYYMCNQVLSDLEMYGVRNQSLIMGGDVCLWTEFVDDEGFLPRLWPRASAAAERLWSAKSVQNVMEAAPRIEEQRCRMKRRGIPTGVLSGPGHCRKYAKPGEIQTEKTPFSFFNWKSEENDEEEKQHKNRLPSPFSKNIYIVDMNSMYVVPLLVIVFIVCMTLLAAIQDTGRSRLLTILTMPVKTTSRRGFKTLMYVFMVFALVWGVWTAPIWMHAWENSGAAT